MLRSQMRNIAPFLTLICLFSFFAVASPSFATLDNFGNILTQISITGIIAVGLTFVILCAEIDLSVAAIANVTGIAVAYFTAQESYVNIANMPMPGWVAIVLALALCASLGLVNALRADADRHPLLHHDAGDDADRGRHLGAAGARADRLQGAAPRHHARIDVDRRHSLDRDRRRADAARRPSGADLYPLRPLRLHGRGKPRGGGIFRAQRQADPRQRHGDFGGLFGDRRHARRGAFRQRAAERVRHLSARFRSPPSWSAAPVCLAAAAASATPSSACSCSASSTTGSITSTSTVS